SAPRRSRGRPAPRSAASRARRDTPRSAAAGAATDWRTAPPSVRSCSRARARRRRARRAPSPPGTPRGPRSPRALPRARPSLPPSRGRASGFYAMRAGAGARAVPARAVWYGSLRRGRAVPNPIAPLIAADESFTHQIPETFAAVASSDPAWTEKVCAMALARDGSLQIGFGLGKYPNRNVMDGYAAVSRGVEQSTVRASRRLWPEAERTVIG